MEKLSSKLAAIFHADIVGYSRLTGQDEFGTYHAVRTIFDLIEDVITSYRGRVVNYAGDAILAEFGTATDAVSSAIVIQRRIEENQRSLPNQQQIRFRIGINLGDVIVDGTDIFGDGVNIAARVQSLAEPGEICITDSVRRAIGSKLALALEDLGRNRCQRDGSVQALAATTRSGNGGTVGTPWTSRRCPR